MKKLIVLSLAALFCLPLSSYATSIGGAETQGKGKLAVGLDQEFIFDRDMKSAGLPYVAEVKDAKIDKLNRTMLKTSYGVFDNLDVYIRLGVATNGKGEDKEYVSGVYDGMDSYKYKNAFAYGFGLKGTHPLKDGWLIGMDLQYLRHKNSSTETWTDAAGNADTTSGRATIQEWQVAPYAAKKLGNFIPYLGCKYSDLRVNYKEPDFWEKYKADDNVGVFVGTDYKIGNHWKVNLEGRFVDETAMSFGATYKF
jgi:hypothetical protein